MNWFRPKRPSTPRWNSWTSPGSSKAPPKARGLGNQFLGNIRETDAIAHVVRCFEDDNVQHVSNKIDPVSDIEVIQTELMIADMESLERRRTKLAKTAKSGDAEARFQTACMEKIVAALNNGDPARKLTWSKEEEIRFVKSLNLLTAKPVLYVCNIGDPADGECDRVQAVKKLAQSENSQVVALCGQLENEIMEIEDPEERKEFMREMELSETGLDKMIKAGYALLELVTFFTVGGKENRAWTLRANQPAPKAAGVIHTDFEKGFIRAEVYNYDDLLQFKTEQAIKDAGKLRIEGKTYIIQDGDIVHFRFNV